MKNIHVFPTDKYSDLVHSTNKYGGYFLSRYYSPMKEMGDSYQNIYITNDEEIKERDWYYLPRTNSVHKCIEDPTELNLERKLGVTKIILTTDQELIKDGLQSIEDEFLEWFVKNSICEEVEVIEDIKYFNVDELRERHINKLPYLYSEKIGYKIIIQKKEIKSIKDKIEDFVENCRENHLDRLLPKEQPKQETLEEAAEKMSIGIREENYKDGFIDGAKWKEGQDKNKFSEEEVEIIAKDAYTMGRKGLLIGVFNKWFEQFKNK